jgi:ferredoxin
MAVVKFKDKNIEIFVREGTELVEIYRKNPRLPMRFGCTRGDCGVCSIEVFEGMENLTKKSKKECETLEKKGLNGDCYRLGCQCTVNGDITISFNKK